MCGRFTLQATQQQIQDLLRDCGPVPTDSHKPRYNIAPSQPVLAACRIAGRVRWDLLRWGMLPPWSPPGHPARPWINARAETLDRKPAFRTTFRQTRCLLPADGFFEWPRRNAQEPAPGEGGEVWLPGFHASTTPAAARKGPGGRHKTAGPWYFQLHDGAPFFMAGLWTPAAPGKPLAGSCVVITTVANALVAKLHHRMPVMLDKAAGEAWLHPGVLAPEQAAELLRPYDTEHMRAYPVSTAVNRTGHDAPDCVRELDAQAGAP